MWRLFRNIRCSQSRPKTLPLLEFTLWSLLRKYDSVHIIHIICHMMHILSPMFFVQTPNLCKYWICAYTEFVQILNLRKYLICVNTEFAQILNLCKYWICANTEFVQILNLCTKFAMQLKRRWVHCRLGYEH